MLYTLHVSRKRIGEKSEKLMINHSIIPLYRAMQCMYKVKNKITTHRKYDIF